MTYEQNVKAVLETYFFGFRDEIIDNATKRICEIKPDAPDNIGYALKIAIIYNGYDEIVREWANIELATGENMLFRSDSNCNEWEAAQIEIIWMMLVIMFGDWGTSPRYGWIEKIHEFRNFVQQITEAVTYE